ncbi:uncharacterized protein LOC100876061 [Megachile rotundata]|uniref:uncharacterized protein LOC100876061 n=1 Tax=Megachile rotundata TaxID=143995 RepID=UPI003FD4F6D2
MYPAKRLLGIASPYSKRFLNKYLTSKPSKNEEIEVPKASEKNEKTEQGEENEKNIVVNYYDQITAIGINRPDKKNCLNVATAEELSKELDKFENDENSVVGVLYGVGGNFCSGYDLKEIAQYNGKNEEVLPQFSVLSNRNSLCKKPLIAAINGYALGVGLELALMCDLRVIEESALLGFTNRRFNIPILSGGTVRLPALIGYSRAMDLILTGRILRAKEAFTWGLANRYTCEGAVLGEAVTVAKSFVKFSQKVLLADRASAHFATFSAKEIEEALQFEKDNASHLVFEEGVKGAKRFVDGNVGRHGHFQNITNIDLEFKELDKDLL